MFHLAPGIQVPGTAVVANVEYTTFTVIPLRTVLYRTVLHLIIPVPPATPCSNNLVSSFFAFFSDVVPFFVHGARSACAVAAHRQRG